MSKQMEAECEQSDEACALESVLSCPALSWLEHGWPFMVAPPARVLGGPAEHERF